MTFYQSHHQFVFDIFPVLHHWWSWTLFQIDVESISLVHFVVNTQKVDNWTGISYRYGCRIIQFVNLHKWQGFLVKRESNNFFTRYPLTYSPSHTRWDTVPWGKWAYTSNVMCSCIDVICKHMCWAIYRSRWTCGAPPGPFQTSAIYVDTLPTCERSFFPGFCCRHKWPLKLVVIFPYIANIAVILDLAVPALFSTTGIVNADVIDHSTELIDGSICFGYKFVMQ